MPLRLPGQKAPRTYEDTKKTKLNAEAQRTRRTLPGLENAEDREKRYLIGKKMEGKRQTRIDTDEEARSKKHETRGKKKNKNCFSRRR